MSTGKVVLIIMDGWGLGARDQTDAIAMARTPYIDALLASAPSATLLTDGRHVGLPGGQMGNSEVGHLNIGAGRVVFQDLVRVDNAIADGSLELNPVLQEAFAAAKGQRLHLIGLLSDGGVHSKRSHAEALCQMAGRAGLRQVYLHAFTDGRDADPRSGRRYLEQFLGATRATPVKVASVIGRYYAMDRDKRWERIKVAYDLLVHGKGEPVVDPLEAFDRSYSAGTTDEFIPAHTVLDTKGAPVATIQPGDVVLCFNFRTDRCREISVALTQRDLPEHGMHTVPIRYVTMTEYDATYKDVGVLFRKDDLPMTLGEVVEKAGLRQVRIAETEKYPHVTYFFSGGRERPFALEERIMIPSPKVATYDLQPEMSAQGIVDAIVPVLEKDGPGLVVLNFANPDMVGHTGVFDAIVRAVETTDYCTRQVAEEARASGYSVVIIADHGNADQARNADGSPNTAHSTNPVPVIVLADEPVSLRHGVLADVAPTILDLMGIEKPVEMTGSSLIGRG
ncbi:MAG: 2,3-bisphosphoglycerate-independent phosphoglycerate mutase [Flavobacteriales bacterium]|nr:2,3-bisphosphoglycerate-independent phosphoglycerate mutase [Flavobacteriales bacterium]